MMEYHATKYQRKNENALPRAFYFPSPTKDFNQHEVICSPSWSKTHLPEDNLVQDDVQLTSSALPHIAVLNSSGHDLTNMVDSRLDETWPNSEKSSSLYWMKQDRDGTSTSVSPERPQKSITEIVRNLETYTNRYRAIKGRLDEENIENSESVLKRYIERFRNSDPKPREQRRIEAKKTNQDFWWLESTSREGSDVADKTDKNIMEGKKQDIQSVSTETQTNNKLTREALLAIDEETMRLQMKADRLLTQSESSLMSSSGPIVSTDGLGSSRTESEVSSLLSQPPYRPSFLRQQEIKKEMPPPKSATGKAASIYPHRNESSHPSGDDILLRWRLNRKLESCHLCPSHPGMLGQTAPKTVDPRLEEFRSRLLSQKALITKEEIDFERHRMALLLDDDSAVNKKSAEIAKHPAALISDPILQRMSEITNNLMSEITNNLGLASPPLVLSLPVTDQTPSTMPCSAVQDTNFSNAISKVDITVQGDDISRRNKNNTASSISTHGSDLTGLPVEPGTIVLDSFDSQVICDPKDGKYLLSSGDVISNNGDTVTNVQVDKSGLKLIGSQTSHHHSGKGDKVKDSGDSLETSLINSTLIKNDLRKPSNMYHQYLEAEKPMGDGSATKRIDISSKYNNPDSGAPVPLHKNALQRTINPVSQREISQTRGDKQSSKLKTDNYNQEDTPAQVGSSDVSSRLSVQSDSFEQSIQQSSEDVSVVRDHQRQMANRNNKKKNLIVEDSEKSLRFQSKPDQTSLSESNEPLQHQHPIQDAIGQAVTEHIFDGPSLYSSVDSWASMFPQSPGQSLHDWHQKSPSPRRAKPIPDPSQLQSTPKTEQPTDEGEGNQSDGEFEDDTLLFLLREQRRHYLRLLEFIELKLQKCS